MSLTDIWVLSCPKSSTFNVQKILKLEGLTPTWEAQPYTPPNLQSRIRATLEDAAVAKIASEFSRLGLAFEITQSSNEPCLILGHPGLGLKRLALDSAGEVVIRQGQLARLITEASGSASELERLLRVEAGTAWLDLLEPYRNATLRLNELPRAV